MTKRNLDDLAIFGQPPAFAEELCVGRPNIGDRRALLARIEQLLDSRWLTNNGPLVQEFERRVADLLGVKHCLAICNATVALEIAIRALGLKGEVIVPSFTFIATAHALQWQEITPVFCDIDPRTHTLDPALIEDLITQRTTGIIGVHLWSQPCAIEQLTDICERRDLRLLFDSAHAFNCSYGGRMIGNFGDAEVFSFHATKFFNTFEGGAITTNDDELAAKIRLMKNFGFAGYDQVVYLGTNGKMPEISAAMGLTSLESLDEFVAVNRRNYQLYQAEAANLPGLSCFHLNEAERNNFQYIVFEVNETETGISRDDLVNVLWAENIKARRYFYPGCHRMEPYRTLYPGAGELLPATEALTERTLLLPNGTTIGPDEVNTICEIIRTAITHSNAVKRQLSSR
ncbi:MAG: aminotransferase class I/II-fold pyridoxal phosphate-dependent enzyme [Pyrinomonadaceae bacterium]